MTRGRKPKSAAQKALEGNPGHRAIKGEPQLEPALPAPPDTLTAAAVDEWNRVAPELFAAKILTNADRGALAFCCQSWADWVKAREVLAVEGMTVRAPSGFEQQSPWVSLANRALSNYMKTASEFGLTPASRVRLAVEKGEPDDDQAKKEKQIFGEK